MHTHSRREGGGELGGLSIRSTFIRSSGLPPACVTTGAIGVLGDFLSYSWLGCPSQAGTVHWRLGGGQLGENLELTLGEASWCQRFLRPDTAVPLTVSLNHTPTLPINPSFV